MRDDATFLHFLRLMVREPFFWLGIAFLVAASVLEYRSW